ncbi:sensor histidine kinase [Pseudomonas sp. PSE14]|uniref:HAMP domain-containing sensor histidine kinase n=1 Tax=Pseudomonas sp. PSE14 TaxID=3016341 RepID=UPI0023D8186F|nr:sensor histidine kinase [Pseudomonas sp. PSE14]WEJ70926.1 histidine kinase sensor domain-containing protein [Pseudomonas sp. PSE14]
MAEVPGRHSLFWRLAVALVAFCLLLIWLSWSWGKQVERQSYYLSAEAREVLGGYAREAEQAWRSGGAVGVDAWLAGMRQREEGWMTVVDARLQALGNVPLSRDEVAHLTFQRGLEWPVSSRSMDLPYIGIPFPGEPTAGRLVLQLPARYLPSGFTLMRQSLTHGLLPAVLALLLCALLYRYLVRPLARLREHANALQADYLGSVAGPELNARRDELGELGRALDHMAERLRSHVSLQRQLLRDLSHELRTPLSRLRVAGDSPISEAALRQRVEREVEVMQRLVADTLELAWLDTERPHLEREDIDLQSLWELLVDDARFEAGWAPERFLYQVPTGCRVRGHLNGLARALENLLRNAIRHSPLSGCVRLGGRREGQGWHLWLEDDGAGVPEADLERIFQPFTRLSAARSGEGFGLGLSIARSSVRMQGGELWADCGPAGLRVHLRLPAAIGL